MIENHILRNIEVLDEDYIPERLIFREREVNELKNYFLGFLRKNKVSLIITGPSGSGKTTTIKWVSREFEEYYSGIKIFYVNCWKNTTNYSVLYSILEKFYPFEIKRRGKSFDEILELFDKFIEDLEICIILDEVDKLENDALIYNFLSRKIPLIMISNREDFYLKYDPRILSRLSPYKRLNFNKYSIREIIEILKSRIEFALYPGTISEEVLEEIADRSKGDARIALSLLRSAAIEAENKNKDKITLGDLKIEFKDENLSDIQKHLFEIIREYGEIDSRNLYIKIEEKLNKKIPERTLRYHLNKLHDMKLIEFENTGRWRIYKSIV